MESDNNPEIVANFCAVTNATPQVAVRMLQIADNNLESAIALYLDEQFDLNLPGEQQGGESINTAPSSAPSLGTNTRTDSPMLGLDDDGDAEMAQRLQEDLYRETNASQNDDVRAPIAPQRDVLVGPDASDFGLQTGFRSPTIPLGRSSIFNQRPVSASAFDLDDDDLLAQSTGGASTQNSKANRLAKLYRPPFELMENIDFERARSIARERSKWILINIQDTAIFQCQMLNRDLWSKKEAQESIKENFIFLQYSSNSVDGQQYNQFYNIHDYPYFAVIDPRTGEQVKVWNTVLSPGEFIHDVHEFLDRYSLNPKAKNPHSKKAIKAVDHMTEEEQLNLAVQNSVYSSRTSATKPEEPQRLSPSPSPEALSAFAKIPAIHRPEPDQGDSSSTRMQLRLADGTRSVRRFGLEEPVQYIFETIKADIPGATEKEFELIFNRSRLSQMLASTIEEAGLHNASVVMEFV